jgi:hypothetical protein
LLKSLSEELGGLPFHASSITTNKVGSLSHMYSYLFLAVAFHIRVEVEGDLTGWRKCELLLHPGTDGTNNPRQQPYLAAP